MYEEKGTKAVAIFEPSDSYIYQVIGTDIGTYKLFIGNIDGSEGNIFTATDIPTSPKEMHQYSVDWGTLSQGKDGVTIQIDSNGDGVFERTIIA